MAVSDDFDRADNADLGADWTTLLNSCRVAGNGATGTSVSTAALETWSANSWNADHTSEITVNNGFLEVGAICRAATGPDCYIAHCHWSVGRRIYRMDDGSWTQLSDYAGTVSAGDTVKLEVSGTSISFTHNGSSAGTAATDSTYSSGAAGIYCSGSNFVNTSTPEASAWAGTGEVAAGGGQPAARRHAESRRFRPVEVGREGTGVR